MTTTELIKALRETDFSNGCPCEAPEMCKDADCIIAQAADRLEELDERVSMMMEGHLDDYDQKKHSGLMEE